MIIPKKIKIGGHEIKVKLVGQSEIDTQGLFDRFNHVIRLRHDNDEPESKRAECLLHEIFEAITIIHNIDMDHRVLTTMSECLFQVLRDNKLDFSNKNE